MVPEIVPTSSPLRWDKPIMNKRYPLVQRIQSAKPKITYGYYAGREGRNYIFHELVNNTINVYYSTVNSNVISEVKGTPIGSLAFRVKDRLGSIENIYLRQYVVETLRNRESLIENNF